MGGGEGTGPSVTAIISTVWGCPFDGEVSVDQVEAVVRDVAALGVKEIGLADKPALFLGMREMRVFRRVAIDFPRKRVLFDLPG